MADRPSSVHFQPVGRGGYSLPVAVLTAIGPVLREALLASLLLDAEGAVALRYEVDENASALRRLVVAADGVIEDELVHLDHPCASCAMREDAVPTLARLAGTAGVAAVLLAPPLSAEPSIVAGTLRPHQDRWHLTAAVTAVDLAEARADLLGEDTLAERGLQWAAGALAASARRSPPRSSTRTSWWSRGIRVALAGSSSSTSALPSSAS